MVAFLLLQFLAYRYIHGRRSDLDNDGPGAQSVEGDGGTDRRRGGRLALDGRTMAVDRGVGVEVDQDPGEAVDERRCPHCGTENEPDAAFVYCRECGGRLGIGRY